MKLLCILAILTTAGDKSATETLPASWHGDWAGELVIVSDKAKKTLPMRLEIHTVKDRFSWRIIYVEGEKKQVRDYELVPQPDKPGRFVIDEKNGILIDARLTADVLVAHFKVNNNLLHTRYEVSGDTLRFEISVFRAQEPRVTTLKDAKLEVHSHEPSEIQRAVLKKVVK